MFKVKYDENERIVKYKVRLVMQEFSQHKDINYEKTFTSTVRKKSLRIFLTIVAALNLKLH